MISWNVTATVPPFIACARACPGRPTFLTGSTRVRRNRRATDADQCALLWSQALVGAAGAGGNVAGPVGGDGADDDGFAGWRVHDGGDARAGDLVHAAVAGGLAAALAVDPHVEVPVLPGRRRAGSGVLDDGVALHGGQVEAGAALPGHVAVAGVPGYGHGD